MKVWKRHFQEDDYREEVTKGAETDEASDAISGLEHGDDGADENNVLHVEHVEHVENIEHVDHGELAYTTGVWANRTMYQCTRCPFSTLDLETIERHLLMHRTEDELLV